MITITATTTAGTQLPTDKLQSCMMACDTVIKLVEYNNVILQFVEKNMNFMAPNLTAIVGPSVAAKLMGAAGGLQQLSRMPGGYIKVIGNQKKTLNGLSAANVDKHGGFISACDIIQKTPPALRKKAQELIGSKCALAARVDCYQTNGNSDNSTGMKFREEIEKKIEKILEPAPYKDVKPLPAPKEGQTHKRAGKRVRKRKELFAQTEIRKLQNRMAFGEAEKEAVVGDSVKGLGLVGGLSGKVRGPAMDNKVRNAIKKARVVKPMITDTSGFATTISFTPVQGGQGFELFNPEMSTAGVMKTDKYFGSVSFKKK
jgi:U4/U6 small nuclear ribonucleoprotein PRP31